MSGIPVFAIRSSLFARIDRNNRDWLQQIQEFGTVPTGLGLFCPPDPGPTPWAKRNFALRARLREFCVLIRPSANLESKV